MRRLGLMIGVLLICDFAAAQSLPCTVPCDTGDQTFSFAGNTRHYRAYFPANISANVPYTALFYLPGYETAAAWDLPTYDQGEWNTLLYWANANGVAIVYASPLLWDSASGGQPATPSDPLTQAVSTSSSAKQIWDVNYFNPYLSGSSSFNDAGYLDYLVSTATSGSSMGQWGAGTVAMIGFSTGGLELERFAIAYPWDTAGVGIWAGPLYAETRNNAPVFNLPVNVFLQQGSADPIFDPCGNGPSNPATVYYPLMPDMTNVASQDTTFNFWSSAMSCQAPVPNMPICTNGNPTPGFTGKIASGCAEGKQVQFTFVIGKGHNPPTYQGICNFYNFLFPTIPCIPQANVALSGTPNPASVNASVTFTATVTGGQNGSTPTGTVRFMKGSIILGTSQISAGQATLNFVFGGAGTKPITAVYSGDVHFGGNTSPVLNEVIVNGAPTTTVLTSGLNPSTVGQPVLLMATVSSSAGTPTGTVSFYQNGTDLLGTAPLNGGVASLSYTFTAAGAQTLTATYSGDGNFMGGASSPLQQVVNQASSNTMVTSSLNPSLVGQSVNFTATVSSSGGTPTGTIKFMSGTMTLGTAALSNGVANLSYAFSVAGAQSITAIYSGDPNFLGSTSSPLQQVVNQASTTTMLTSNPNPSAVGQSVILTATVSSSGGMPTGTVNFISGTNTLGKATVSNGVASLSYTFNSAGTQIITAVYSGDANFLGGTSSPLQQTVNQASTTTTLTSNLNPSVVGQWVVFTATVSSGGGTPTGTITFMSGTATLGTSTLNNGVASLSYTFNSAGPQTITATYSGDANFLGGTSPPLQQVVNQAGTATTITSNLNPSVVGQSVTFTAMVSSSGGVPTGTVKFMSGTATLGNATLSNGVASFSYTFSSAGTQTITAVYSGDPNFLGSTSSPLQQVVNQAASTTMLTSNLNPSAVGQSVIFTATVSSNGGMPTGTVKFTSGATTLGNSTLTNGVATLSYTFNSAGPQTITAAYSGDANFLGSTSTPLPQVVVQASTVTTLSSSVNPSQVGQSVIFTATVSSSGGTPTGTVTFMKGNVILGSSTLSGGQASFIAVFLGYGVKSITASYSGDANFVGSASSPLEQAVNPASTTTMLVSAPNPSSRGQSVTLTATVAPQYGGAPTGTVTFMQNGNVIGLSPLVGGQAIFSKIFNNPGTKPLSAVYSGDMNFLGSTGTTTQTVQ